MSNLFAQVILPLPLHDLFTYRVPQKWRDVVVPGQRVIVQFGAKKFYAALIYSLSDKAPKGIKIKDIVQILDKQPIVFQQNFILWKWIASYYCCTMGDVFRAAIPPGLKLESKTKIVLTDFENEQKISDPEFQIVNFIKKEGAYVDFLQKKLGDKFSYAALTDLLEKNIVRVEEKIDVKYKPKTENCIKFTSLVRTEEDLDKIIDNLKRAPKQRELILSFCDKIDAFKTTEKKFISKNELLKDGGFSNSVLNELVAKKILMLYKRKVSRIEHDNDRQVGINILNSYQQKALEEINNCFEKGKVALIHGITASGKTEIYIHLIDEVLKKGKQALYLLPEIALTTQIIERLKNVFGKKVGVYHSKLNSQERVEVWNKTLKFKEDAKNGYQVILGARSALFMPFSNLGIVIVDEEHENTFKQFDPAPRYNARDMAVVMAIQNKANVLLGSATPSFESLFNAVKGKYGLVNLMKRHSNTELPQIIVTDIKRARKKKQMRSVITPKLYELIENALKNDEQVILFQNRRGYSPFVQCLTCGWIPKCKNCDVSLTYHKFKKRLSCHYCGFSIIIPDECPECGSKDIETCGFGTEKIEDELKYIFPGATIDRMDFDTTRSKNAVSKIIKNIENKKTDILIGTQMVTKGLDFEHVSVVGILNVDNLINFPDFRAHERAYQLVSQVSGRAGRKYARGKVVIQTSQPDHPLIELMKNQDFNSFFLTLMRERKLFKYPPYCRLIKLRVKHKNVETVNRVAEQLAVVLKKNRRLIILGPEFPLVNRVKLWYNKEIWIKIMPNLSLNEVKSYIVMAINNIRQQKQNSSCIVNIDVDPV